ncbi:MAG: hypothetical protein ACU0B7_07855 [Paracoccaceae bacterium]|uniref:hypothetical protein n=1 Tax=Seohaeicola saemankumensis TaxID=481181 RepID=UPI001E4A0852|nr:hypothetical protein [Seohaeicola saemankumensis]MCD1625260.1 hypothetical protein [Seohaeicola saemankumensis]
MSFNPPEGANASIEDFEKAIEQVEAKLGLEGQPRAIVFHEKDGRRHLMPSGRGSTASGCERST